MKTNILLPILSLILGTILGLFTSLIASIIKQRQSVTVKRIDHYFLSIDQLYGDTI